MGDDVTRCWRNPNN